MKSNPHQATFSALDRLEEATRLLRATPARDYVLWLFGTGPFALGLLYFWADQSRSITAAERLPVSALGLALLFLWARLTQALFAARLHARLTGASDPLGQAPFPPVGQFLVPLVAWQAIALALLPLALILVVPFPAYLAFQQSLIVTVHQAQGSPGQNLRMALRQSVYQPQQTSSESSLLCLSWLVVALNTGVMLYALPQLAKLLFGIESPVTLHPATTLNTTFAAAVVVLATLALDPLMKAVAVLRDFEMGSRTTGADLLAGLRRIPLRGTLALLLLFAVTAPTHRGQASEASAVDIRPIPTAALNRAITEVLDRPEFTWREVRPESVAITEDSARSFWQRWRAGLGRAFENLARRLEKPVKAIADWFGRLLSNRKPNPGSPLKLDFSGFVEFLLWLLLAGGTAGLALLGIRIWQQRRAGEETVAAPAITVPDLEADHVSADQLPEDGWMAMARELADRGEHRPALRALYLACLAGLAAQERLRLGRAKSNRDYELEVRRRTRDRPQIAETFSEIVRVFEWTWHGARPVSPDRFRDVAAAVERLRNP
jgi:Domain of unknown function (DUF4129)